MTQGKFIVFEGIDGAGQSTQAPLLAKRLEKEGYKVLRTTEPTNNLIGGIIRAALTGVWKTSNTVVQLLYAADRGHHLEREILPALEKGFIVISERYFYSSIAFGSLDMPTSWLREINTYYPEPDLGFYIRVRPKVAMERITTNRHGKELFEKEASLTKIAKTYETIMKDNKLFTVIDGEQDIDEIHNEIYSLTLQHLKLHQ